MQLDQPSLIEVYHEDEVISETSQAVSGWHGDDEGEDIIDERVESLTADMSMTS